MLTVALAAALGRTLFGRGAGWIAGLLVALSPFAVYYSQETRMYALLGLLSAASMALFVRWMREQSFSPQRAQRTQRSSFDSLRALRDLCGWPSDLRWRWSTRPGCTRSIIPFTMLAQALLFGLWIARLPGRNAAAPSSPTPH